MYLIIPLTILIIALAGISVIVWRKLPYIRKLTPESFDTGGSFMLELLPEAKSLSGRIKIKVYKDRFLMELEKVLRRLRLFFLKIDSLSEGLIKKVRRGHRMGHTSVPVKEADSNVHHSVSPVESPLVADVKVKKGKNSDPEELKRQEQILIMEIAKSPKNLVSYLQLGDIYHKMGDLDDAREAFQTVLKLDPDNATAKERLDKISLEIAQQTH